MVSLEYSYVRHVKKFTIFDDFVKSPEIVMPDLRSLSRTVMRGHPEVIEFTGLRFSLE
jgi:hypothetical protein